MELSDTFFWRRMKRGHLARTGHELVATLEPDPRAEGTGFRLNQRVLVRTCCPEH